MFLKKRSLYYDRVDENGLDLDLPPPPPPPTTATTPFRYDKSDRIAEGLVQLQEALAEALKKQEATVSRIIWATVQLRQRYNDSLNWAKTDGPEMAGRMGLVGLVTAAVYRAQRNSPHRSVRIGLPLVYGLGSMLVAFPLVWRAHDDNNNNNDDSATAVHSFYTPAITWAHSQADRFAQGPYAELVEGLVTLWLGSERMAMEVYGHARQHWLSLAEKLWGPSKA